MSHSFIDPKNDYYNVNDDSDTAQKKIDPVAQLKWLNTPQVHGGWGLFNNNPPAQMFAQDEEEEKQRKPEEDLLQGKIENEELQMKSNSDTEPKKRGNSGTKTDIPKDVRGKMENSFGTDFSGVNIHRNSDQASNIGALAYTQGNDVHFAPGQYNPASTKGQELLGHELTHVVQQRQGRVKPDSEQKKDLKINSDTALEKEADEMGAKAAQGKMADVAKKSSGVQRQEDENVITEPDPVDQILKAVSLYRTGFYSMPQLARAVLPYVEEDSLRINAIFSTLGDKEKDNFAYALAANSTDLLLFDDVLLSTMSEALNNYYTFSREDNLTQKKRVDEALAKRATPEGKLEILLKKDSLSQEEVAEAKTQILLLPILKRLEYYKKLFPLEVASDLATSIDTYNNTLSANVGKNQTNNTADVKKVAKGLVANGYTVNDVSINSGTCDATMIQAIKNFEMGKLAVKSNEVKGYLTPGSWTGDYETTFGNSPGTLNNSLSTWKRGANYNSATGKTSYTIDDNNFIDKSTYDSHIDDIAEDKGIEVDSDDGKAIASAARAARDDAYFDEITKSVTANLVLTSENLGSHQVNPILKHRLGRFHRYLSAVSLFTGDMKGGACRSESKAHKWAIPHVMVHNSKIGSRAGLKNNVINVFNGETVAGGSKDTANNVKDTDGNIWAKPEHFNVNAAGNATSLKETDWIAHMKSISGRTNWSPLIAEGYKKGNTKRFPLGLQANPDISKHITGDAIDINEGGFLNMNDTKIDIIALYFGLSRPVPGEQWHFETVNMALSDSEKEEINNSTRNSVT